MSQSDSVLSAELVKIVLEYGTYYTLFTESVCPLRVYLDLRLFKSQTLTVLSMEQDARKSPQECHATPHTACVCSINVWIHSPLEKSQIFTVVSPLPGVT